MPEATDQTAMSLSNYILPRDFQEALALRSTLSEAALIAGGTAAQLGWPEGRWPGPVLDMSRIVAPAPRIGDGVLRLSAFSRLETLRLDPVVQHACPPLAGMISQIAATAVRHLATLGGNIGWRYGDLVPLLLALDARLAGEQDLSLIPISAPTRPY